MKYLRPVSRRWFYLIVSLCSTGAFAEEVPKTFFRNGVWAPIYGELGVNMSTLAGVDVTLDHLRMGIQMLRFGDVSLTGGYGAVGVTGGPLQKKDAPKNFRAHFHGPVVALHYVPDFFIQGNVSYAAMSGSFHYENTAADDDEEAKVTLDGSLSDVLISVGVKVWSETYLDFGFGARASEAKGEDINLETGDQSSSLLFVGVRGSVL